MTGLVRSVNLGSPRPHRAPGEGTTGIDKRPVTELVEVRPPGPKKGGLGSGIVGDAVMNRRHHGGDDQAVYAVAREELDWWSSELGRELADGMFGENLTTVGVEVDDALLGEIWQVGPVGRGAVLQVRAPRIPCATFQGFLGIPNWIRRFNEHGRCGAYLAVVEPGSVQAGDEVVVIGRPEHDLTVSESFRALTLERDLLPGLLRAGDDLPDELRDRARRRQGFD
ncbi:MOSC domain-containing protein [Aestuariimicrobium ganziense]|uniref:MOSC domain-containing protein n=1 Tax=Aestuariimicrobium ganziense TaxID=2773677 RepID=UPI0019452D24|nr:MOSC domain-containing protein [Aestuariimicrobium ganziense]